MGNSQEMRVLVAVAFLASLFSCERAGPNLESELPSQGSTLLQRNANVRTGSSLALEEEVEHLPLCDPLIVDESCQKVNGIAEGASPASVTWALLADMLSASSLEEAREAMALPSGAAVGCMELCNAAVQYVRSTGGVLPPSSNVACRTVHGNTTCDVEADPGVLARKFGSIADMELPDHGPLTAVTDDTDAVSESGGRAFLYQDSAGHTSRGALSAALLQRGMGIEGNATPSGEVLTYSVWEAVERIANLFCVYPSTGKDVDVFVSSEPVLLQVGTTSADATVAYRASEARTWLATILRNVNGNQEAAAQRQWFGGAGNMNAEQVRQRILRTFNFINREFTQGFYFVVPADNAQRSVCNQGAVAYVWKYQVGTGYQETTGPRCSSRDNPRTKTCALDEYGKYYVYLCNAFLSSPVDYQVGVLIHEAAHHSGPTDVTYDQAQMQRESQSRQLSNAANYQYFAQTVAKGGCSDKDGNCRYYTGYCDQQRIKDLCQQTCGQCNSGGGGGGGGGTCSDTDGNCRFYTSYCNTDNVKAVCKKTCGLCGSGGSGGCADTYGSCQWYKDNNYCGTANVLDQCRRTCGACR